MTEQNFKLYITVQDADLIQDEVWRVADLLEETALKLRSGRTAGKILDANGNSVGSFGWPYE